ncbi:N-acetyltransferase 9 [Dictyostelium discoideum AX4]|uniref:N-acetyltransferase 9-like protein n=1 Tax=Dictyostelium discoideum TaxID=44689 RepID=NAT9_DICDI|nr:N-acetyltransferase 9 [Dictyostelium discoideum AX4]Q86II5.1 RecName: Full=N-acetyltransferase 9-like protein [Dictyostelium discoideum]EAL70992.1 N-acetyltransferase 9 [Dictyostelium discoideum AX4]|eukprot:XP_644872.1 N-acetyltransferase 9 [Dictyostelium discoideum AX4]
MKINSNTIIIGKKVILVPYKKKHVEKYWKWMQSEEIREQTASEELTIEEEFENQESWFKDDHKITFIILDKDLLLENEKDSNGYSNENDIKSMIGDVNIFFNQYEDEGTAELEVMIAEPTSRRKGLAREAISIIMGYGIEHLSTITKKYIVKIGESNQPSIQMFKSMNFKQIGSVNVFKEILLEFENGENNINLLNLKNNDNYKSLIFKNWE